MKHFETTWIYLKRMDESQVIQVESYSTPQLLQRALKFVNCWFFLLHISYICDF